MAGTAAAGTDLQAEHAGVGRAGGRADGGEHGVVDVRAGALPRAARKGLRRGAGGGVWPVTENSGWLRAG